MSVQPGAPSKPGVTGWTRFRAIADGVLFLIGIPTAVVTFVALGPQAWAATHQRQVAYNTIADLHAGQSRDYLDSRLGVPTLVRAASQSGTLTELIYLRREYAVSALVRPDDTVTTFGVFACSSDFAPTLTLPSGSPLTLNGDPLADQKVSGIPHLGAVAREKDGLYIENVIGDSSTTSENSYLVGVSDVCGASTRVFAGQADINATESQLLETYRADVDRYRRTTAPNFYVESIEQLLDVTDVGCITSRGLVGQKPSADLPSGDLAQPCASPAPDRSLVTPGFLNPPAYGFWENLSWF